MTLRARKTSINNLRPALFLHIQKTAGTSILEHVRPHYGASMTSHGDCWGRPPESLNDILFVSGHIGYDYIKHLISSRYSFTFLRNPSERVLSMYYFCAKQNPEEFDIYKAASQRSLESFLLDGFNSPLIKKNIWNSQVWQLAHGYAHLDNRTINDFEEEELLELAVNHLDNFSYIGLTESFNHDHFEILKALKLPLPSKSIVANASPSRPKFEDLPNTTKNILADLTELDQQLYDIALSRKNVV